MLEFSNTPYDSANSYSPSWRHEVAKELAEGNVDKGELYKELSRDKVIANQAEYIKTEGDCFFYNIDHYEKANNLFSNTTEIKHIVEALLLTEISCEAIAKDIGWDVKTVKLYSKLFYDIRDSKGKLTAPPLLISSFVVDAGNLHSARASTKRGILLKIKATKSGLPVLLEDIGWGRSACLEECKELGLTGSSKQVVGDEMFVNLLDRIYEQTISGRELVDLNSSFVREKKDNADISLETRKFEQVSAKQDDGVPIILELLGRANLTPVLVEKEISKEQEEKVKEKLRVTAEQARFKPSSISGDKDDSKRLAELSDAITQQIQNKLNKTNEK